VQACFFLCAAAGVAIMCGCQPRHESSQSASHANAIPAASSPAPLAMFERMVNGRWKTTALAGTVMYDTWHWGSERNSIRKMTAGTAASGEPWHGISVYFWHPSRKEVRTLGVSPFARGVSEGTFTFDGEKANGLVDMHQTIGHRVFGRRWTFEGPAAYHDELLDKVPEGFSLQNEWRRYRVAAASEDELAAERTRAAAAKPSEFIKPIERLLGHTWEGKAVPDVAAQTPADTLPTRTTFEYVPYADAIYGRVQTLNAHGAPSHAMDIYLYHHTGTQSLRVLALGSDGPDDAIVYEGDITPAADNVSFAMKLIEHRSTGQYAFEASAEFEEDGTLRMQGWKLQGQERTLVMDRRQSRVRE
jgi:hypothetical protein